MDKIANAYSKEKEKEQRHTYSFCGFLELNFAQLCVLFFVEFHSFPSYWGQLHWQCLLTLSLSVVVLSEGGRGGECDRWRGAGDGEG